MKRICRLFISLGVIGFALALLVFAQKQTQKPPSERIDLNSGNLGNQEVAKKKGKNLVKKLPDGVEGVTLEDGLIKLKPSYKFEKGKNDKVSIYLSRGVGRRKSVGGEWSCECSNINTTNDCKASIQGGILYCISGKTCTACDLSITVGNLKQAVIAY